MGNCGGKVSANNLGRSSRLFDATLLSAIEHLIASIVTLYHEHRNGQFPDDEDDSYSRERVS